MKKSIVIAMLSVFILFVFNLANAQTCRTPGDNRTVIFMPAAYHLHQTTPGDYSQPCQTASQHHQYIIDASYIEEDNPETSPTVTLTDFINEMQAGNIGIMYFDSHGGSDNISVEFFEKTPLGLAEAQSRYDQYISDPDINSSYIGIYQSSSGYSIGITDSGLDYWCTNLGGTLVYAKACHSSGLNDNWDALVALGYDETISGYAGNDTFWERMDGTRDRGPENTERSVDDARDGIAHLVPDGNLNVVLSPVVLSHQPEDYGLVEEGQAGFVEFDCEMDQTVPANEVVTISGTIGTLTNVHWANNHRIEFTVTNLEEFATIDFNVQADKAVSEHNGSELDGNTNPNETDGVGPNGDFYTWTSLTSHFAMMDFEDGVDGNPIQSSIPGMEFITTEGYDWIYGDKRTGNYNIYPYNAAQYWCDGNFFAWLGPNQGHGRINFTGATATSVCMGTSNYEGLHLDAYDEYGNLIDSDFVSGNLNTNTLSQLKVSGSQIDHVIVHNSGNYWLIDNLMVVDLLQETLILLPEDYAAILDELHTISPGGVENFLVLIENIATNLQIILNWFGSEMKLAVYDPDGLLYGEYQTTEPPIEIEIVDPKPGEWRFEVTAVDIPEDNYPFAIVAATKNAPLVDCYINNSDISFDPEQPIQGEIVDISATIHCDATSEPIDNVRVRCYLGDPDNGGTQIDEDEYAINLTPGSSNTVYFHLNSENCGEEENIYVKIDPENELAESNEDNNKAFKTINIIPILTTNAGADDTICSGSCTTLSGSASGGIPPYTYSWSPDNGSLSDTSDTNPTACPDTTTTYTLTVEDANGCTDTDQVVVTVNPTPVANAGSDTEISSGTCTILNGSALGGPPPYIYSWSPATGLDHPDSPTPEACPQATTIYTLTVTDDNGCTDDDQVVVTVTATTDTLVKIDPPISYVYQDRESIEVAVAVEEVTDLHGINFNFLYDDEILDLVLVEEGSFLTSRGRTEFLVEYDSGMVNVSTTLLGTRPGVNGSGQVALLTFLVLEKEPLPTDLILKEVVLRDHENNPIPAGTQNGTIEKKEIPFDCDENCHIGWADLNCLAMSWHCCEEDGCFNPIMDCPADGCIDYKDLFNFAMVWHTDCDDSLTISCEPRSLISAAPGRGQEAEALDSLIHLDLDPSTPEIDSTISLTKDKTTIEVGIVADQMTDLHGLNIDLSFDNQKLEVIEVKKGDMISQMPFFEADTKKAGLINITGTFLGSDLGVEGKGVLAKAVFKVNNLDGSARLRFDQVIVADHNGHQYDLTTKAKGAEISSTSAHTSLSQNYPNPFNPETWIPFSLSEEAKVEFRIYTITGQLVRTIDCGVRKEGEYLTNDNGTDKDNADGKGACYWDGCNNKGEEIASGVYFYQLVANGQVLTKKMVVLK